MIRAAVLPLAMLLAGCGGGDVPAAGAAENVALDNAAEVLELPSDDLALPPDDNSGDTNGI